MCTTEAPIHDDIKQALVRADERQTQLIFRTLRNTARVLRNKISEQVVALEKEGAAFEQIRPLVLGTRGREALRQGLVDDGVVSAGMVVALIDDVPSCQQLIERIVSECRAHLRSAMAFAEG
jgi:nitronate monooxygenase